MVTKEYTRSTQKYTIAKAMLRPELKQHVVKDEEALEDLKRIKEITRMERRQEMFIPPNRIVGSFGIKGTRGEDVLLHWSVNGQRKDKRHGAVEEPIKLSRHSKVSLEAMFKNW